MMLASKKRAPTKVEIEPGAWERFERLVKSAAKIGHQVHLPVKPKTRSKTRKPAK